jgi:DNA mismatch endonuclease (patch repair protein)
VGTVWACALRKPEQVEEAADLMAEWLRSTAAHTEIGEAEVIADEHA